MPCTLSPPINSSFNIMLLLMKSVNCVLIIISVSNCFGDWINEEPNCCVTNGFHLITMTHFWLCCLFIYRHANCQKVLLGMRTRSVANASTICISVYRQQFNPLLLCTILVFYMCIYSMCLCLFLCAMKEYKMWKIINCINAVEEYTWCLAIDTSEWQPSYGRSRFICPEQSNYTQLLAHNRV